MDTPDLNDYEPEPYVRLDDPEALEAFRVDDDSKASWAMRKLARIRSRKEAFADQATNERLRISQWEDAVMAPLDADERYFVGLLEDYGRVQRAVEDRKTVLLPWGEIKTRSTKAKVAVTDAAAVIGWARESGHSGVVKVSETVLLTELAKAAKVDEEHLTAHDKDTGQPVPGVEVIPSTVTVSVDTPKGTR